MVNKGIKLIDACQIQEQQLCYFKIGTPLNDGYEF